jgi:RNA polymerase sigma factor (TIGR02999 family)
VRNVGRIRSGEQGGSTLPVEEITRALMAVRQGNPKAVGDLMPLVYDQLRAMAHRRAGPSRESHLDTTALVHEAYLKLFDQSRLEWNDRRHFFAVAAMAMRQIVVDEARRRLSHKRGGDRKHIELDSQIPSEKQDTQIVALHEALSRLSEMDERLARIVELRFFAGLSVEEVAEALGISERTVNREWRTARALLSRELSEEGA